MTFIWWIFTAAFYGVFDGDTFYAVCFRWHARLAFFQLIDMPMRHASCSALAVEHFAMQTTVRAEGRSTPRSRHYAAMTSGWKAEALLWTHSMQATPPVSVYTYAISSYLDRVLLRVNAASSRPTLHVRYLIRTDDPHTAEIHLPTKGQA